MNHVGREGGGIRPLQPLSVVLTADKPKSGIPGEERSNATQLSHKQQQQR